MFPKMKEEEQRINLMLGVAYQLLTSNSSVLGLVEDSVSGTEKRIEEMERHQDGLMAALTRIEGELGSYEEGPVAELDRALDQLTSELQNDNRMGTLENSFRVLQRMEKDIDAMEG